MSELDFGYVLDSVFAEHRAAGSHPECPARIEAVLDAFKAQGFDKRGVSVPVRQAQEDELALVHGRPYLAELERTLPGRAGWLDADTYFSEGSWPAILSAAAAAVDLCKAVLDGRFRRGAALVRPPGHHAEADKAMGFCVVNNVAVAAATAREAGARVSILDWDVHHGNGTQHIFEADPLVQYLSIHQYPHYPGTGAAHEVGSGAGQGATVNLAMPQGCGDAEYLGAMQRVIEPEIRQFRPDIVLVSAGFDAYQDDPLAGMKVTIAGFRAMTRRLTSLCEQLCQGRMVAVLEGGYDLSGLGLSVAALLEEMMSTVSSEVLPQQALVVGAAATRAMDATELALRACRGQAS